MTRTAREWNSLDLLARLGMAAGLLMALVLSLAMIATASRPAAPRFDISAERASPANATSHGTLRVLTYNVAGLPFGLSAARPARHSRRISPLLNAFDLVLLQEDFGYHAELAAEADHVYRTSPMPRWLTDFGDGLNRFSRSPLGALGRVAWRSCHGYLRDRSDCLSSKGFSVARHVLGRGADVDVYNAHFDSGVSQGDRRSRLEQARQLSAFVRRHSAGRAVIVAADTNMPGDGEEALRALLAGASLLDACRAMDCHDPGRIDRLLYRSGVRVRLAATSWAIDPRFVDPEGQPLSDHLPVAVGMEWQLWEALEDRDDEG